MIKSKAKQCTIVLAVRWCLLLTFCCYAKAGFNMNKSIEIKHFSLIDYNILLKVVAEYIKQYQISRDKFEYEKGMFDLTNTLYALQCHKNAVNIKLENHWKSFWVKVRETKTKYKFEIWYAS